MITTDAPARCELAPPVPLYTDDHAIVGRLQEAVEARRAVAISARVRDLEALMAEQARAAEVELALADMTYQRDLALAREAALATDRDHWRTLCEWQESALAGRQTHIASLHDRYQRLRRARRQDRAHMVRFVLTTAALMLVTVVVVLAGPALTAMGVVLP